MYKKNQKLRISADFDNAIFFQIPTEVWQNSKLLDYGGVIECHTEGDVKIQGICYPKVNCEFLVR